MEEEEEEEEEERVRELRWANQLKLNFHAFLKGKKNPFLRYAS